MTFANCGAASVFILAVIGFTAHAAGADYLYLSVSGYLNNETIYQIGPTGSVTDLVDSSCLPGLNGSRGEIASDGSGNIYTLTARLAPLELVMLGHGQSRIVAQAIDPFNRLLTADHAGNVYVQNINADTLSKIDSNGAISEIAFPIFVGAGRPIKMETSLFRPLLSMEMQAAFLNSTPPEPRPSSQEE